MTISDAELSKVRKTGSYRAALWLTRVTNIPVLVWCWLIFADPEVPSLVPIAMWLSGMAGALGVLALLARSGAPVVGHVGKLSASWSVRDRRMLRQFYRDMFWFPRP